jgi:hypothetical protein
VDETGTGETGYKHEFAIIAESPVSNGICSGYENQTVWAVG